MEWNFFKKNKIKQKKYFKIVFEKKRCAYNCSPDCDITANNGFPNCPIMS